MSRGPAIAQTMAVVVFSSFAGVLNKLALSEVEPFTLVWLQIAVGGSLLTLYTFGVRRRRIPRGLGREVWGYIIWIGVANFIVVRLAFLFALERLEATTNNFQVNFVSIVTKILSVVVLRERPSRVQVLGAITAIAGIAVFFREIPPPSQLTGVLYVSIGILALASTNNVARKVAIITEHRLSNLIVSTVAVWIGGIPVVVTGLVTDFPPQTYGSRNLGIAVFGGVVTIAVGITLWNYVLRTLRSYEASVLATSTVVWTAVFAMPILGEVLELHQLAGIALLFVGVTLAQVRGRTLPKIT